MFQDDQDTFFFMCCIIAFSLSSFSSIALNLLLRNKQSNYSKLMRYICLAEAIFIYGEFTIIMTVYNNDYDSIFTKMCGWMFFGTYEDKEWKHVIINLNRGFYFCNQTFSLLINNFVCLETILTLRNPISPVRKRLNAYFSLTFLCSIIVFLISVIYGVDDNQNKLVDHQLNYRIFNIAVFLWFVFIGVLSFLYLINRFCLRKNMAANLRNKFVFRHFLYYLVYIVTIAPYYVFSLKYMMDASENNENYLFKVSIVLHLSLGFIMFLIRASETKFYRYLMFWRKSSQENYVSSKNNNDDSKKTEGELTEGFLDPDQPLTVMINKTLNLEFMCCVLYGFSTIFRKSSSRKSDTPEESNLLTINISSTQNYRFDNTNSREKKEVSKKDFKVLKSHLIYYNKIYENFNFDDIHMEVKKKLETSQNQNYDSASSSSYTDLNPDDGKKQDALIIEYCPKIFRELRGVDDISDKEIENSFDPKLNRTNMERIKESEGKSGSFFFFSHDQKFLIKTLTSSELNTFLGEFVISYYDHMINNPDTLLAKIYGVYTIIINNVSKINVVLMQNLLIFPKSHIKRIFDLKGSKVDRFTKNIEKMDKFKTLKDLDFEWMTKVDTELIDFTKHACFELDSILQSDLAMLRNVNIMDYSLMLIVIHFPLPEESEYQNILNVFGEQRYRSRVFKAKNQKYIYCLGIIDYLQKFNMSKFLENKYKHILYGDEIKNVSAVDPTLYCRRMHEWALQNLFVSNGLN